MLILSIIFLLCFLFHTTPLNIKDYPYFGNGAGQSRSPCPFLNAAANHQILPYSGKNISTTAIMNAVREVNLEDGIFNFVQFSLNEVMQILPMFIPGHSATELDLSDLNFHGIEADLSISRIDTLKPQLPGDNVPTTYLVNVFLNTTDDKITPQHVGLFRGYRFNLQVALLTTDPQPVINHYRRNPDYDNPIQFFVAGNGADLISILGRNSLTKRVAVDFLLKETFPSDWSTDVQITSQDYFYTLAEAAMTFPYVDHVTMPLLIRNITSQYCPHCILPF